MRRVVTLLIVCMLSLGPFAQGVDVGPEVSIQPSLEAIEEYPIVEDQPDSYELLSNIDGFFTENKGQKGESAGRFYCIGSPLSVALGDGWVRYLYSPSKSDLSVLMQINLKDSNDVQPIGIQTTGHYSNFFYGNDSSNWVTYVNNYYQVLYPDIYDGIDLVYSMQDGMLKYEFYVQPMTNPSIIQLEYSGIEGLQIDPITGDLLINTRAGKLRDMAPLSYQESIGERRVVESGFVKGSDNSISFSMGGYDQKERLVIDPGLIFSTYVGGSEDDGGGIQTDSEGNVIMAGNTYSTDFPNTTGAYDSSFNGGDSDGFVFKLKKDGSGLIFSTFIGGSKDDSIGGTDLDISDNIYTKGRTTSSDFPVTSGVFQTTYGGNSDGVVIKLNSNGTSLLYSTYIGGPGRDWCRGINIDTLGNAYVTGRVYATGFPTVAGSYDTTYNGGLDVFVSKLNSDASKLVYSTYLGESDNDWAGPIVVDPYGCAVVAGGVHGDFPTTANAFQRNHRGGIFDCFVTKLNAAGSNLLFSTYIGGSGWDIIECNILIDSEGYVYGGGNTNSANFPTTQGAYDTTYNQGRDGFLFKLDPQGTSLDYSTYYGGNGEDMVENIRMSYNDTFYLAGTTKSTDMPTTQDGYDLTHNGDRDLFIGLLDIDGSELLYGSYLGGSGEERKWWTSINLDSNGLTISGKSNSTDFPTTSGAFSEDSNGKDDIVIARLIAGPPLNGTPPSAPMNLSVTTGIRQVTLEWDEPEDIGGANIRGYTVYRGLSEESLTPRALVGRVTRYTETPSFLGQKYYYCVCAHNFFGEGNQSQVVNVTVYGYPEAVPQLTATSGCATVTIEWSSPHDTGGLSILGYRLYRSLDNIAFEHLTDLGDIDTFMDTGLENGNTYYYKLVAFNELGDGPESSVISSMPQGPPSEPRFLTLTEGDARIVLHWNAPLSDGGNKIMGYQILRGPSGDMCEMVDTVDGRTTEYIDEGLENGVEYFYSVQSFNEIDIGPPGNLASGIPLGLPSCPVNLTLEASDGQVLLSWEPPMEDGGTSLVRYEILRGVSEDQLLFLAFTDDVVTSFTDNGLRNGQTFHYSIYAVNSIGTGKKCEVLSATPLALPDAPGDLIAVESNGVVILTWLRPVEDGGAQITMYSIYRGSHEDTLERMHSVAKSTITYKDENVEVGKTYYYAITAITDAGEGPPSIIVSATPFGPPGMPNSLSATPGNGEVRLSWSPPSDDGASRIEGYVILRGTSPSSLRELDQLADVTSYLDSSVTNDQIYYYAIAAINEAGPGVYTDPVSATPFKSTTAPGRVLTLAADTKGTKVTLQWTAPIDDGGSPVTGYVILRGLTKDSLEQLAEVGPGVTTWSKEGLERGITYYYSVAAKNDVGQGEPILAREIKVPKKADESPGFEALVILAAILIVIPITRRRRG